MTTRRRFLAAVGVGLCAPPLIARAQTNAPLPRVGFVLTTAPLETMQGDNPSQLVVRGFLHGMRELEYQEGRDYLIERRTAEGKFDRLPGLLRGLAESRVEVIVVTGTAMVKAAMGATSSIPIVAAGMGEAQALSYAKNFAAPERNLTGVAVFVGPTGPKRLEILRELLPRAKRIGALTMRSDWEVGGKTLRAAAGSLGLEVDLVEVRMPDLDGALGALSAERFDALLVSSAPPFFVHAKRVVAAAARIGLPDFHYHSVAVEEGGLASYGHDAFEIFRRSARHVVAILKGAKPGEVPIDRIERYSLVLNLKTAQRLGLSIPTAILLRADRVIE